MDNIREYPAVTREKMLEDMGTVDSSRLWYPRVGNSAASNAWVQVQTFADMIEESTNNTIGPFGNTWYQSLDYADLGDVVSVNWGGSGTATGIEHAMVVTRVNSSAPVGQRGMADIYIAAHSTDRGAYEQLSVYLPGYNETQFATCVIDSGFYPVAK